MENKPSNSSPFGESEPIYYDVSPKIVNALRVLGGITAFMVVLSFILTLVQASSNNRNFYMLTFNIVLTSFVGLANVYWYWKGQLAADKHWYMLLVGLVIIWQCIATDIYVFHLPSKDNPTTGTTIATTAVHPTGQD